MSNHCQKISEDLLGDFPWNSLMTRCSSKIDESTRNRAFQCVFVLVSLVQVSVWSLRTCKVSFLFTNDMVWLIDYSKYIYVCTVSWIKCDIRIQCILYIYLTGILLITGVNYWLTQYKCNMYSLWLPPGHTWPITWGQQAPFGDAFFHQPFVHQESLLSLLMKK